MKDAPPTVPQRKPLTPEQIKRRAEITARTKLISGGVKRGPNAHPDGTFGKLRKTP